VVPVRTVPVTSKGTDDSARTTAQKRSAPRKASTDQGNGEDLFQKLAATRVTSPSVLPPPVGSGGGGSLLPPNLFDDPPPKPAAFAPSFAVPLGPSQAFPPLAAFGGAPPQKPAPAAVDPVDSEWDSFVGFDDAKKSQSKNQNDLWSKHKNLFDLQHLDLSEKEAAAAAPQQKRAMGAMATQMKSNTMGSGSPSNLPKPSPGPAITSSSMSPLGGGAPMFSPSTMGTMPMGTMVMGPYPGMPYGMPYGAGGMMAPGMVVPTVGYAPGMPGMVPMGYTAGSSASTFAMPYSSAPVPLNFGNTSQRPQGTSAAGNSSGSSLL
jgi:hypothetical protein